MELSQREPAMRNFVSSLGIPPEKQQEMVPRLTKLYGELLNGSKEKAKKILTTHDIKHNEMVVVKDIPFYSFCEHHFLPFFGQCHIGYIPSSGKVLGIGKISELVDILSKRAQLQETLTTDIVECLEEVKPKGIGVVITARHLCMEMQGKKQPGTEIITSAVRGLFKEQERTRSEFFSLIK